MARNFVDIVAFALQYAQQSGHAPVPGMRKVEQRILEMGFLGVQRAIIILIMVVIIKLNPTR